MPAVGRGLRRACLAASLLAAAAYAPASGQGLVGLTPVKPPASGVVQVIVRGSRADATYAGFTVALRMNIDKTPFCTGSIVAVQWVLTSKHCTPLATNRYQVWTGSQYPPNPGRAYTVDHVVENAQYDVALLKLTEIIEAPGTVIPLMPTSVLAGQAGRLTGWGTTSFLQEIYPDKLRMFDGVVDQRYSTDDEMVSIAGQDKGCAPGDSGGPFFVTDKGPLQQIGIFIDRGRATNTCFYVRTSKIYSWVQQTISGTAAN